MTTITDQYTLTNDVKIPKVGFGTYQIPAAATKQIVLDALQAGYRHLDTAKNYGNEAEVGAAVRESGLARTDIFVTTKLPAETKTYQGALADFNESLTALGLDYVDLYLIHAPEPWDEAGADYDQANREVWRAMEEIYQSGRAKAIGVSNFDVHDLKNILTTAKIVPMVDQIQYYIGYRQAEITDFAQANHILVEAFTPLARGALATEPQIQKLAAKYQIEFAQLAIQYCLQNGTLPLPKSTTLAHIQQNTKLNFEISPADMTILDQIQDHSDIWHFTD
ncbi:aldo/keto reductase [Lapidilactobacillus wuchangensis]|uniref:aldo/keto reductase n=1 Tax=Lapidilactobacillus wuchangensis TaxID=2486001 RepID=UPI000F77485E|nr:aldo/keto reductase [Lapidilactobacillus wuchangensis]